MKTEELNCLSTVIKVDIFSVCSALFHRLFSLVSLKFVCVSDYIYVKSHMYDVCIYNDLCVFNGLSVFLIAYISFNYLCILNILPYLIHFPTVVCLKACYLEPRSLCEYFNGVIFSLIGFLCNQLTVNTVFDVMFDLMLWSCQDVVAKSAPFACDLLCSFP